MNVEGREKGKNLERECDYFHMPYGIYEQYFKRMLDFVLSLAAIIVLWPILLVVAILVRIKLGSPVIFSQKRPGKDEKIFRLHKFRSMTDERGEDGELLPDNMRLTSFGKRLRNSSLDELPELFDILVGNLSIVGPRPQLIRDMVFMSDRYRQRHDVMPGLTGLAQISGRNSIGWEEKLEYDLQYMKKITFRGDLMIILKTVKKALIDREGITEDGIATATDYGDYLLKNNRISKEIYDKKQKEAQQLSTEI